MREEETRGVGRVESVRMRGIVKARRNSRKDSGDEERREEETIIVKGSGGGQRVKGLRDSESKKKRVQRILERREGEKKRRG